MDLPELYERICDMASDYLVNQPESEFQYGWLGCLVNLIREFEMVADPDSSPWLKPIEKMLDSGAKALDHSPQSAAMFGTGGTKRGVEAAFAGYERVAADLVPRRPLADEEEIRVEDGWMPVAFLFDEKVVAALCDVLNQSGITFVKVVGRIMYGAERPIENNQS